MGSLRDRSQTGLLEYHCEYHMRLFDAPAECARAGLCVLISIGLALEMLASRFVGSVLGTRSNREPSIHWQHCEYRKSITGGCPRETSCARGTGGSSPRHASEAGTAGPILHDIPPRAQHGAVQGALTRMRWRRSRSGRGGRVGAVVGRRRERCTRGQRVSASRWSSVRIGYSAYPDGPLRLMRRRTLLTLSHGGTLGTECPPWGTLGTRTE
jgi:hypothetical protein